MSVDTTLDSALGLVISKARSGLGGSSTTPGTGGGSSGGGTSVPATIRPATLNFEWAGASLPLVVAQLDPVILEVPFAARISQVKLRAGDALGNPSSCTATVDVFLSQYENFGGRTPLYGTGTLPGLSSVAKSSANLSGWKLDLATGDTITAKPLTFSGTATWIALTILLVPTDASVALSTIVDSGGNTMVDSSGNTLVLKG